MKVKDLLNVSEGLAELSVKEFPVVTALKLRSLNKKVSEALEAPLEVRKSLVEKYKDGEDDNGNVKLKKEHIQDFQVENEELMEQDIEIELKHIKIAEIEHLELKPRTLILLEEIIEFE